MRKKASAALRERAVARPMPRRLAAAVSQRLSAQDAKGFDGEREFWNTMKRKGPQKHSTETIQKAIAKYEGGARLSVIARELGLRKSTVKYWRDNATKFLREEAGQHPETIRI